MADKSNEIRFPEMQSSSQYEDILKIKSLPEFTKAYCEQKEIPFRQTMVLTEDKHISRIYYHDKMIEVQDSSMKIARWKVCLNFLNMMNVEVLITWGQRHQISTNDYLRQ